jgi:hypothetical protein
MKSSHSFRTLLQASIITIYCLTSCKKPSVKEDIEPIGGIKILEAIEVDSVVADFPVGFKFITQGEYQYVGYYNKYRELTVASRKKTDSKWRYKILPSKVGWDSHNRIAMAIDRYNCIHLSGNMHNDSLTYFKTTRPNDISSFERVFPQVKLEDELSSTYPNFIKGANDELIFSYRKGGSGNGITISNTYDERTKSFTRLTDQPLFDGLGQMSAYARGPSLGPDNMFHVLWLWRDTPACETNHDLSYARSADLVNWETMAGEKIELPITPTFKDVTADPIPAKGGVINGGAFMFFDKQNKPMLGYFKYDKEGNSQVYITRFEGGEWVIKQVSDWNYRWNFSGPGSITFEIRLNGGSVNDSGQILIDYTHVKKGNGQLVIDSKNLSLIEDRQVEIKEGVEYPEELLPTMSNIDSTSVKWLKSPDAQVGSKDYYALRWETMGKRRFYKEREKPVKPSIMMLYKFNRD